MLFKKIMLLQTIVNTCLGLHCGNDHISIDLSASKDNDFSASKLLEIMVEKQWVESSIRAKFMKVSRRFQYCTPKAEVGESDLCRTNNSPFLPSDSSLEKGFSLMKCPVGKECKEYECKGADSQYCLDPRETGFISSRDHISLNKATSLLFYTCVQNWACEIREMEVQLYLGVSGEVSVKSPLYGNFIITPTDTAKIHPNSDFSIMHLETPLSLRTEHVRVKCFTQERARMCYDKFSKKFIPLDERGKTCLENACYTPEGGTENLIFDENSQGGKVTDLLDLDKLYRVTQFIEMQSIWDVEQTNLRVNQIERLISKVLGTLSDKDFARIAGEVMGRPLKLNAKDERKATAVLCRETPTENDGTPRVDSVRIGKHPTAINTDGMGNYSLFYRAIISSEMIPEPQYKIDSLSYTELFHLESFTQSSTTEVEAQANSSYPFLSTINWYCREIGIYTGFIVALTLLLSLKKILGTRLSR